MSSTLSYGYKLPANPDKGSTFFPDLEHNIQRVNDHNHDGSNSAPIPSSSVSSVTATIAAAGWVAVAGQAGTYRQLVTSPAAITYDNSIPKFKDNTTGHILELTVEKVTSTTYYVYINDNTVTLKVYYLT